VLNFIQSYLTHAELVLGRPGAGPAVVFSFVVAAIACGFAALCYAELASMIPVSGSAYTYSYATLGEIIAWIIGWDLILEYAVGNMAVAVGWSGYFVQLFGSLRPPFTLKFPLWLVNDYQTATDIVAKGGEALNNYSSTTLPVIAGHPIAVNLPAFLIVAAVTVLLIYGIRESARTNTTIVLIKVAVVVFVISFGAFMVNPTNWHPFVPNGFGGVMSGAAIVFFAFIGFDAVSTTAEETKNPQRDLPRGMIYSLIICTVVFIVLCLVLTGMASYNDLGVSDAGLLQRSDRDVVCAGALGKADALTPEISKRPDRRLRLDDDRLTVVDRPAGDVDDCSARRLSEDGRGIACRADIDAADIHRLQQRRPGRKLDPFHRGAVFGEALLQDALLTRDHQHTRLLVADPHLLQSAAIARRLCR